MEVNCGEAKLTIEGNEILHIFNDTVISRLSIFSSPNLANWITDRLPKEQRKRNNAPHKYLTFRVALQVCEVEFEKALKILEQRKYITVDNRPNKVTVAIPTAKATALELTKRKNDQGSFLWDWQKLKELLNK